MVYFSASAGQTMLSALMVYHHHTTRPFAAVFVFVFFVRMQNQMKTWTNVLFLHRVQERQNKNYIWSSAEVCVEWKERPERTLEEICLFFFSMTTRKQCLINVFHKTKTLNSDFFLWSLALTYKLLNRTKFEIKDLKILTFHRIERLISELLGGFVFF